MRPLAVRVARPRPPQLLLPPQPPADEAGRLARLRELGLLDTGPDADCDRLVQLAALACEAPMAMLSLVGEGRQWHKSRVGVPVEHAPREHGLCAHAILTAERLLEVPDTALVPWFDPQLYGPHSQPVRFYAGVPLRCGDGSAVGTLCVMDQVPRRLTEAQRSTLDMLAQAVCSQLELRRQLRVATQTDRLTGLPNWSHFESQFGAARPARGVAAFVRLRTVGQISSAHGFRVADALIQQAAQRLREVANAHGALVGRVKRGLFILFFPGVEPQAFENELATQLVERLALPYAAGELNLVCPVNLGVAAFPRDGRSLDEVVNAADSALQLAIEREETMASFDKTVANVQSVYFRLEPKLRQALAEGEFVNHYQPKIDLATGRIVGVEALVRWEHPQRGLVPPSEFVPALESTGLIAEVGAHTLRRALADWNRWREQGLAAPRIALNVAAAQLRSERFVEELAEAVGAAGAAGALSIEVTESALIVDMRRAAEVLRRVRELGIPVAIDDFGTGYSSLAYLVSLPIDEVKIDRCFVQKSNSDPAYRDVVETCISLAHNLGLKVVAEGVEAESQASLLRELGCDQAQGFLYSAPLSTEQLARMLQAAPASA
ncbi:putative bifunctional diguanylate cyclase/phosphodiesterase [Ramlibacter tataouinensis]|nr:EAL domain-containing protein [Ramlibacter tataouinensis]